MSRRSTGDVPALVEKARQGDARSVARLISLVEDALAAAARGDGRPGAVRRENKKAHQLSASPGHPASASPPRPRVWWTALRRQGKRVGVLAVDPSSPFSGGALLGDRVRMQDHALDPEVYIRSMASRGHLGGLSWATPQALRVLDAAGCDVILVKTVGVGQSEVEVAAMADTTLVLLSPGHGRRRAGGQGRHPRGR